MKVGKHKIDVQTVDDCLDILEAAFQSELWNQLGSLDQMRLIERVDHILGIAQERFRSE